ncbi:MAG: hypothetical protein QOI25_865 [Mycobacterium sp.]|nr:hypothetical protein [Mycobacterium sp.]
MFFLGMGRYALAAPAVLAYAAVDAGSNRTGIVLTVGMALPGMAVGRLVADCGVTAWPVLGLRDACRSDWQNDVEPVEYCQPAINFCHRN